MAKRKVTILGAGNAGCVTALQYQLYAEKNDLEVELIYNPEVSPEPVGQATLTEHPELLWKTIGFDWYNNNLHATFKSGILYEGWGKKYDKWFHPFPAGIMAMHYCPWVMQQKVLESGFFKVVEDNITDINDIDSNFIFDCRGKPKDFSDYYVLKHPINSAILGKPHWNVSEDYWSRHVATLDGWTFVIPTRESSPSHDFCVGYCYNKDITQVEEAEKNFLNMFDVTIKKKLEFKNYIAQNPVIDDRIILNGNKLFFLEPLESSSSHTYLQWAKMTKNYILFDAPNPANEIIKYIKKVHNFILWHYQNGSRYDTNFWRHAKTYEFKDKQLETYLEYIKNNPTKVYPHHTQISYTQWHCYDIHNWYECVTL